MNLQPASAIIQLPTPQESDDELATPKQDFSHAPQSSQSPSPSRKRKRVQASVSGTSPNLQKKARRSLTFTPTTNVPVTSSASPLVQVSDNYNFVCAFINNFNIIYC